MKLESGKYCWNVLPEQYVKVAVTNVEEDLARNGKRLPSKFVTLLSRNNAPWLEDSPDMMADVVERYQELIGQIRWAVVIVCLDLLLETFLLSRYLVMPQVRHLELEFRIFLYFKVHLKRKLGFDPSYPDIYKNGFQQYEWK